MMSTQQLRNAWQPACSLRPSLRFTWWSGVPVTVDGRLHDAYKTLDHMFKLWRYAPRSRQTWGYNCRRITGGTGYSLHAYGIAVDVNSLANPYGRRLVTDMPREMIEAILAIRTNNGQEVWGWGGNYLKVKDGMHFEIGCSPADLATGIDWATVRGWVPAQPVGTSTPPPPGVESGRKFPGGPDHYWAQGNTAYDGNVEYIQRRLGVHSPADRQIKADGFFGPKTTERVKQFQQAKKLKVDGRVDAATWKALG